MIHTPLDMAHAQLLTAQRKVHAKVMPAMLTNKNLSIGARFHMERGNGGGTTRMRGM